MFYLKKFLLDIHVRTVPHSIFEAQIRDLLTASRNNDNNNMLNYFLSCHIHNNFEKFINFVNSFSLEIDQHLQ